MTAQDLKNAIIQLAVQGKLVPQDPNDEPASELLKRIKTEKDRLIKEGKAKKEKPLSLITDDAIPFDIPESWEWIKLGEVVSVISGTSYKSKDVCKTGVRVLRGGNLQASRIHYYDDDVFLPDSFFEAEKTIRRGDILIVASTGSKAVIGKPGFAYVTDNHTQIGAFLRIVRPLNEQIIDFLRVIFDSEFYRNHIRQEVQGMNINNVKTEHITGFVVPLPPLAEQQRIVAKIEELMPLVDEYGEAEDRLTELNAVFPDRLRKSILQQAIQGKLTERDPADESASELLKRIRAEKERLIKEGKVYREKDLKPIIDEDIPFDIPEEWEWCKLGELTRLITKGSSPSWQGVSYTSEGEGILFVTSENVGTEKMLLAKRKYVEAKFNDMHPASILHKGDLLTNIVGASIGRTAVFNEEIVDANINQAVCIIRLVDYSLTAYLLMYLNSSAAIKNMTDKSVDSARANLSLTSVTNLMVPLPPLAEQQRIVDRVNELLAVCDELIGG